MLSLRCCSFIVLISFQTIFYPYSLYRYSIFTDPKQVQYYLNIQLKSISFIVQENNLYPYGIEFYTQLREIASLVFGILGKNLPFT